MVIFSHRGIGFGKKENSLEAITCAVEKSFSVEVDLRLKGNSIVLSHDPIRNNGKAKEFNGLLKIIKENPQVFFALHLKEDSQLLFKKACDSIRLFKNCFLFVADFKQDNFITHIFKMFGKEQAAFYINDKNLDLNLANKVNYFWLDETKECIYESLDYFEKFNKKIICCSPEIFFGKENKDPAHFKLVLKENIKRIFGICTDYCLAYKAIV